MTFDFTINAPTILSGFMAIIVLVGWLVRLESKANGLDAIKIQQGALEGLVLLHHQQYLDYRLEAAEKYVTQTAVNEIKRDLGDQMRLMEGRIEQSIDRAVKAVQGQ
jgi:hypothetical protein